jgi:hypothetical protein
VGEGFLHVLLNETPPIDWLDSAQCSKQGIRHCDTEPFRLFRTKDEQNELYHFPLSIVSAIPGVESIFQIVLPSEFSYIEIILAASPPFSFPGSKPVNLRPDLSRPLLRIMPDCSESLVPPLKEKFPQCCLTPKIPGFGEEPLTTHPGKVLDQLFQLRFTLRDGGRHIFQGNRDLLNLILLPCFRHFATHSQTLNLRQILSVQS